MAIGKKDRKYILQSFPRRTVAELAKELGLKPEQVKEALASAGVRPAGAAGPTMLASTAAQPLALMILITVVALVYLNSVRNGFHYDDIHSLTQNLGVQVEWTRNPESRSLFLRYFTEPELFSSRPSVAMPRPLLMCTFGLNYMISRYDAWSWMLVNILLHMVNVLIVYLGLCHLSGRHRFAFLTALLWAVHPINSETVNYINCRSESMSALFMLLTMYFFSRSLREDRLGLRIAAFIIFGLGLLTKELVIVTPALAMAVDYLFLYPEAPKRISLRRRALGWYLPLAALAFVYLIYRNAVLKTVLVDKFVRPLSDNLLIQARVLVTYLRLLFFPAHLNISYENSTMLITMQDFIRNPFIQWTLPCILLLCGIIGLAVYWHRRHPLIAFAIANFFIVLSITSIVPLNAFSNEHRLYLPSLSACLLLAGYLDATARSWRAQKGGPSRWWPLPVQGLTLAMILFFCALTMARNFTWYTDLTVWLDSVTKAPHKAQVVSDLGNAYYRSGRELADKGEISLDGQIDKADKIIIASTFKQDLPVGPITPEIREQLDNLFIKGLNRAELLYMWAIRVEPDYYKAWHNLGTINYTYAQLAQQKGDNQKALDYLNRAVVFFEGATQIAPNGESFNDMASAILQIASFEPDEAKKTKLYQQAEEFYTNAIKFNPELCKGYTNLGLIKGRLKKIDEAMQFFDQGIKCNPLDSQSFYYKGWLLMNNNRAAEAVPALKKCLEVTPSFAPCQDALNQIQGGSPNVVTPP